MGHEKLLKGSKQGRKGHSRAQSVQLAWAGLCWSGVASHRGWNLDESWNKGSTSPRKKRTFQQEELHVQGPAGTPTFPGLPVVDFSCRFRGMSGGGWGKCWGAEGGRGLLHPKHGDHLYVSGPSLVSVLGWQAFVNHKARDKCDVSKCLWLDNGNTKAWDWRVPVESHYFTWFPTFESVQRA